MTSANDCDVPDLSRLALGESVLPVTPRESVDIRASVPPRTDSDVLRLCLFGCAPDTGNRGVSALCFSTLSGIAREAPGSGVTVFDNGRGHRWGSAWMGDQALSYSLCGGRFSRRLHQGSSLWNIHHCAKRGGLGNPAAAAILNADALLDVSGGDSFTDLYGARRFGLTTAFKKMALDLGRPLVLLPQTYGPFKGARERELAKEIVRGASMAWARDDHSFAALKSLLGPEFDSERHRCGVDLAFGLPSKLPERALPPGVEAWLAADREHPVIGLNVSGLIYNDLSAAKKSYGLLGDYKKTIDTILGRFLRETNVRILLVAHVVHPTGVSQDDDLAACRAVLKQFDPQGTGGRIASIGDGLDQSEIKYIISKLDWFCGTRMHSTIAALSTGVPASAVAYSGKTLGVFESCGQGEQVADPRELDSARVCDRVWRSWIERDRIRESLQSQLPPVLSECRVQMREIVAQCRRLQADRE